MSNTNVAQRLTETLGHEVVATAPDDVAPWLSDWRGLYKNNGA